MIPSTREIASALYGAYRLARFDAGAMAYFDDSAGGFWRSFFAGALIAPLFAVYLALNFDRFEGRVDGGAYAAYEAMTYIVSWLAYPVVIALLTQMLGCAERFVAYIVAYNWASIWQSLIVLPLAILNTVGVVPGDAFAFLYMIVFGAVLVYIWAIARIGLGLPALTCVAIVLLDLALTRLITAAAEGRYLPPVS